MVARKRQRSSYGVQQRKADVMDRKKVAATGGAEMATREFKLLNTVSLKLAVYS